MSRQQLRGTFQSNKIEIEIFNNNCKFLFFRILFIHGSFTEHALSFRNTLITYTQSHTFTLRSCPSATIAWSAGHWAAPLEQFGVKDLAQGHGGHEGGASADYWICGLNNHTSPAPCILCIIWFMCRFGKQSWSVTQCDTTTANFVFSSALVHRLY